jgi:hypothetical protein
MNILEQQIINQELTDKSKKAVEATASFNKYLEESRAVYKEAFFQIAVVSAGMLSLSVTYVGYITSISSDPIICKWLLFIGWVGLTIAVLGGLLRNYLHANMGHWQMQVYRIEALRDLDKVILNLVTKMPSQIANITTKFELDEYIETLKSNLRKYEEGIEYNKKKEKLANIFWLTAEKAALLGLGIGVVCIVIFAAINLPN